MTQLYKLAEDYRDIEKLLDYEDEYPTREDILKTLDGIKDQIDLKVANVGKVILELKASAEAVKVEQDRLAKRRSGYEARMEWLKSYLLTEMQSVNLLKVVKPEISVSVRNNPASVEVDSMDLLPKDFVRIIPEQREPDKKKILEHFKATGEIITGTTVITNRKHLEVR